MVIGVDVGGTNTDSVVLAVPSGEVLGKHKAPTTPDVTGGIIRGLQAALARMCSPSLSGV